MVGRQWCLSISMGSFVDRSDCSAMMCTATSTCLYGSGRIWVTLKVVLLSLNQASKSRLSLFAAALLFSTGGAAIKACSLSSWQVAGFRSGIAAAVLYIALPGARRGWTARTWMVGLAYAATMVLFVLANKLTTSANAIFLQSTAPLYLLLLGPLVLREPLRKVDLAVISIVAAGALLLLFGSSLGSGGAVITAPDPRRGNGLALVAGVTWALTITGLR